MPRHYRAPLVSMLLGFLLLAALATVAACSKGGDEQVLDPKVSPPVIGREGVLRAGIDLDHPPFGASVEGEDVGLEVDVAAALADRLGLSLEVTGLRREQVVQSLADGEVDVVLAALPMTEEWLADVAFAGSYVYNAPVFFSSAEETLTMSDLSGRVIGVQTHSAAYWSLRRDLGSDFAREAPTLREALEALEAGEVDVVAGDAIVGSYIARDFSDVGFSGQIDPAVPLGVAVAKDSTELEEAVRQALDQLAADGVLEVIWGKWVEGLPELEMWSEGGA